MKFTLLGAWMLLIVSILHLLRIIVGLQVTAGTYIIPIWMSYVGFVVPFFISIMIFKEAKKRV